MLSQLLEFHFIDMQKMQQHKTEISLILLLFFKVNDS